MCGIVIAGDFRNFGSPASLVEYQFLAQAERGQEGFGFVSIDKRGKVEAHRSTKKRKILPKLSASRGHVIAFHHRFPTSTANSVKTAHPITVKRGDTKYHVIHNGIISNEDECYTSHCEQGLTYSTYEVWTNKKKERVYSFNDSESLAHELAKAIENPAHVPICKGSAAWAVIVEEDSKAPRLLFGRNFGNPLKLTNEKGLFMLSSEGAGKLIEADKTFELDPKTGIVREVAAIVIESGYAHTPLLKTGSSYTPSVPLAPYASMYDYDDDRAIKEIDASAPSLDADTPDLNSAYSFNEHGHLFISGFDILDIDTDELREELRTLPALGADEKQFDTVRLAIDDELEYRGLKAVEDVEKTLDELDEKTVAGFVPRLPAKSVNFLK